MSPGAAKAAIVEAEAALLCHARELGNVGRGAGGIDQNRCEISRRDDTDVRVETTRLVDEQPPGRLFAHSHDARRPARVRHNRFGGVGRHDQIEPIDRLEAPAECTRQLDGADGRVTAQMIA